MYTWNIEYIKMYQYNFPQEGTEHYSEIVSSFKQFLNLHYFFPLLL